MPSTIDTNIHLAYLHSIWCTPTDLRKILKHGNPDEVYENVSSQLLRKIGIPHERAEKILHAYGAFDEGKIFSLIESLDVSIVPCTSSAYPLLLNTIPKPPPILYIRWIIPTDRESLSVVGSRKCAHSTQKSLRNILPSLMNHWVEIVSGWALWVDICSHEIALENHTPTHVIYGCGIDVPYPFRHKNLYENIIEEGGSLISPFPLETQPIAYNFPVRNTLVAAMSRGTLIAQAALKSWTLITARLALEHDRDVFVLPWDPSSDLHLWSNTLIKEWLGKMALHASDILSEWWYRHAWDDWESESSKKQAPTFSSEKQELIYTSIRRGYTALEVLVEQTGFTADDIHVTISQLEIAGHIRRGFGGVIEVE